MTTTEATSTAIGIVAIGRNEGERLRVCLESAIPQANQVVYVDSGSSDGSVEMARGLGASVVELDTTIPFTAARARNAGFERLETDAPGLRFVQFVDGDCELDSSWLKTALDAMQSAAEVVVVCGRRRERYPEHTIYNLLCDMEWDTPIGEANECGGDSLVRAEAFRAVRGFRPDLIAGEEPELCSRLREKGGRVLRIDAAMTLHDAQITAFSQWWLRAVRAGYANAEGAMRQAAAGGKRASKEVRGTWFWGLVLPISILILGLSMGYGVALVLAAGYPMQVVRIALHEPKPRFSTADQWIYASACVFGKWPNLQGQLRFWLGRLTGRRSTLIEYKGSTTSSGERS